MTKNRAHGDGIKIKKCVSFFFFSFKLHAGKTEELVSTHTVNNQIIVQYRTRSNRNIQEIKRDNTADIFFL